MRILFCKISAMKFYKGVIPGKDEAFNGGSFVKEHGEGNEQYNFAPVISEDGQAYCLGFVETKSSSKGKHNELHIENIQGCDLLKDDQEVDDVLVIWCATTMLNETSIVGWYQNATVFRNYQSMELDNGDIQDYNILAKKEDCVLLPEGKRHNHIWDAPVSRKRTYGFGQSLVWYAQEEKAQPYIKKLSEQILNYDGENWIDKSAEE